MCVERHTILLVRFNSKQKSSLQAQAARSNVQHPTAALIHCAQSLLLRRCISRHVVRCGRVEIS